MIELVVEKYVRPSTIEEAYTLFQTDKKNYVIAGGAWMKLSLKSANTLISLDDLGLNEIQINSNVIEIGSMVTLRDLELNPSIQHLFNGILSKAVHQIMGVSIRNLATIGGSVMGKYAFSDIIPVLLVLNTTLEFYKNGELTLEEFLANPRMERDILLKIKIKDEFGQGFFKKVAITPLDFAILNIAISKNADGFNICVGSTPYIGSKAKKAMEYINSLSTISDDDIKKCAGLAVEELKFSKNVRSSKEYREELAKVYIKRGLKKVIANEN